MIRLLPALLLLAACSGAVSSTDSDTDGDTDSDTDTDTGTDTLPPIPDVFINEILASNDTAQSWTDADDEEQFDDWLELYNATDETLNLTDWGLSDGGTPWRFPAGTTIAPKGFLLVWCSDGAEGPGYHTDFAISRSGEVLTLTDAFDQTVDQVDMPEQTTDETTYRSPDGSATWKLGGEGTPGASNP